eukprot:7359876-Alexandrium_andersonii.AAC.1
MRGGISRAAWKSLWARETWRGSSTELPHHESLFRKRAGQAAALKRSLSYSGSPGGDSALMPRQ